MLTQGVSPNTSPQLLQPLLLQLQCSALITSITPACSETKAGKMPDSCLNRQSLGKQVRGVVPSVDLAHCQLSLRHLPLDP